MSFLQKLATLFTPSPSPIPPQPAPPIFTIPERYEERRAAIDRPQETPAPQPTPPLPAPAKKRVPQPQPEPDVLTAKQLASALDLCAMIAERKSTLPILSCCLLSERKISATNLDQYLELEVPLLHLEKPVCVNLLQLHNAVARMGKATLTLDILEDNSLLLNGVLRLSTLNTEDWSTEAKSARIGDKIGQPFPLPERWSDVAKGMTLDESRLSLYGVGIDLANGICAASNGHHLYTTPMAHQEDLDIELPVISARVAAVLTRLPVVRKLQLPSVVGQLHHRIFTKEERQLLKGEAGDLQPKQKERREELNLEQRRAQFVVLHAPGVTLWSTIPAPPFPDYTQVVPKQCDAELTIPKSTLEKLLDACAPLVAMSKRAANTHGINFTQHKDGLHAEFEIVDFGAVKQVLPVHGLPMRWKLGLSYLYLSQMVKTLRVDPFVLKISGVHEEDSTDECMVTHPIVCSDETLQVVLMPMRVFSDTPVKAVSREQQPAA